MKNTNKNSQNIRIAVIAVGGEGIRIGKRNNPKLLLMVNGQPFLVFVLNLLLGQFEKLYLLTGSYGSQIEGFVRELFPMLIDHRISLINGGKEGNAKAIAKLSDKIDEPFLYMDGNVICSPQVIRKLTSLSPRPITLLVSPVSLVETHLHVKVCGGKIVGMLPIVANDWGKRGMFCSLGVMVLDPYLFNLSPRMADFSDLDLFIEFIFQNRPDVEIQPLLYRGWWCCIHTMKDIQFARKYGAKLFNVLAKRPGLTFQKGGEDANVQKS